MWLWIFNVHFSLTSSMHLAEIRKPPHISQTNSIRHTCQQKLSWRLPWLPAILLHYKKKKKKKQTEKIWCKNVCNSEQLNSVQNYQNWTLSEGSVYRTKFITAQSLTLGAGPHMGAGPYRRWSLMLDGLKLHKVSATTKSEKLGCYGKCKKKKSSHF